MPLCFWWQLDAAPLLAPELQSAGLLLKVEAHAERPVLQSVDGSDVDAKCIGCILAAHSLWPIRQQSQEVSQVISASHAFHGIRSFCCDAVHPCRHHRIMETEILHVRHLNDLAYCPRRFALKHLVGMPPAIGLEMASGLVDHSAVIRQGGELKVFSEQLGLVGRVDSLRRVSGQLVLSEHKRSADSGNAHDCLQVQALAACLDEMGVVVDRLELHDRRRHRTFEVQRDHDAVAAAAALARELLLSDSLPPRLGDPKRCRACSVKEACGR